MYAIAKLAVHWWGDGVLDNEIVPADLKNIASGVFDEKSQQKAKAVVFLAGKTLPQNVAAAFKAGYQGKVGYSAVAMSVKDHVPACIDGSCGGV